MSDSLSIDTLLAPTDGSDTARSAIEYAVEIAGAYHASLHIMYIIGDATRDAIKSGEVSAADAIGDAQSVFDELDRLADRQSVPVTHSTAHGFSTRRKLVHPGSVILDTADQIDADFLVIPRDPPADSVVDGLEKAAEYVLSYASQPVLSV